LNFGGQVISQANKGNIVQENNNNPSNIDLVVESTLENKLPENNIEDKNSQNMNSAYQSKKESKIDNGNEILPSRLAKMRGINNPNVNLDEISKFIPIDTTENFHQPFSAGANIKKILPKVSPLNSPNRVNNKKKEGPFKNFQKSKLNHYSMNSVYKNFVNQ